MGQSPQATRASGAPDLVITNALILTTPVSTKRMLQFVMASSLRSARREMQE